jgi:hypothetical protein
VKPDEFNWLKLREVYPSLAERQYPGGPRKQEILGRNRGNFISAVGDLYF